MHLKEKSLGKQTVKNFLAGVHSESRDERDENILNRLNDEWKSAKFIYKPLRISFVSLFDKLFNYDHTDRSIGDHSTRLLVSRNDIYYS